MDTSKNNVPSIGSRKIVIHASLVLSFLLVMYLGLSYGNYDAALLVIWVLGMIAILLCRLIVHFLSAGSDGLIQKVCPAEGRFDCSAVLQSKPIGVLRNFNLADIGISYFASMLLFMEVGKINAVPALGWLVLAAALSCGSIFATYCLGYQLFILRRICKLCCFIILIIWVQTACIWDRLLHHYPYSLTIKPLHEFFIAVMYFVLSAFIGASWLILSPLLDAKQKQEQSQKILKKWKKNYRLFKTLLNQSKLLKSNEVGGEIVISHGSGDTSLVVALNLYCHACAGFYSQLVTFIASFPGTLNISLRFRVYANDSKQAMYKKRTLNYLLSACFNCNADQERIQLFSEWFKLLNLNKLKQKWPSEVKNYDTLIELHQHWFVTNEVTHTPSLFINGRELPKPYAISDLTYLLQKMLKEPVPA